MYMQHLAINRTGNYRKATLNGKEHYVVPMALITPGVLKGSKGALHYPPEEISRNYDAWNGIPLVVNHPMVNGKPVSARSASILESHGIGIILNAKINSNQKLVAEGWFDIDKTNAVDPRIISAIERGEQIELSTGLFTDNIPVKNSKEAIYNGKQFTHIARNYRPDHLAILPDDLGACSINDGCGVGVLNSAKPKKKKKCAACLAMGSGCNCSPTSNATSMRDNAGVLLPVRERCRGCGKRKSKCECEPVENANPEGCNQYKSCSGKNPNYSKSRGSAQEASRSAHSMSKRLDPVISKEAANLHNLAVKAKSRKDHQQLASGHAKLADSILSHPKSFDEDYQDAYQAHQAAEFHHSSTANLTANLSNGEETTTNELSYSELHVPLEKNLSAKFPGAYLQEVYRDYVIFRYASNLYQIGYSVDKKTDVVSLDSEMPTIVRKVTTFKPVESPEGNAVINSADPLDGLSDTTKAHLILNGGRGSGRKKGSKNKKRALSDKPFNRSSLLLTDEQSKAAASKQKPAPTIDDLLRRGRKTLAKEARTKMFGADAMPTANVGKKKGWTDEARAKAAATRAAKKKVKASQANLDAHLTSVYRDKTKQKETKASELKSGQHFISSNGSIHRVTGVSKTGAAVHIDSVVIRESRGTDGKGGIAWTKPFGWQTSPTGEVRSTGAAFGDSKYRVIELPTNNVFSDEARAAALEARRKLGQAAGAVGKAGKAAVVSGVKAGSKKVGGAFKEIAKTLLGRLKEKLGIKSKPVKMAKDKTKANKAAKVKAQSRLQKLEARVKANKEARKAKLAAAKEKKAQKKAVSAKVKAVTKQGKANKRAKQVASFQAKKAEKKTAVAKANRAKRNAEVKTKVASIKDSAAKKAGFKNADDKKRFEATSRRQDRKEAKQAKTASAKKSSLPAKDGRSADVRVKSLVSKVKAAQAAGDTKLARALLTGRAKY